jgi:hypothetical protein
VENISRGGLFVRTAQLLPIGTEVELNLVRPGMKRALRLTGRVVNHGRTSGSAQLGMGIELHPLPPDDAIRLAELLKDLGVGDHGSASPPPMRAPPPRPAYPSEIPVLTPVAERATANKLPETAGELRQLVELKDRELAQLRSEVSKLRSELRASHQRLAMMAGTRPTIG